MSPLLLRILVLEEKTEQGEDNRFWRDAPTRGPNDIQKKKRTMGLIHYKHYCK